MRQGNDAERDLRSGVSAHGLQLGDWYEFRLPRGLDVGRARVVAIESHCIKLDLPE